MNVNQNDTIAELMAWLEDNMASQSELHFDNKVWSTQKWFTRL